MKIETFCLLAFCALVPVFAVDSLREILERLRSDSLERVSGVDGGLKSTFKATEEAANERGIFFESKEKHRCTRPHREFFSEHFYPKKLECEACHDQANDEQNIMLADACCHDIIADLERRARIIRDVVLTCLENLANNAASGSRRQ